MSVFLTPRWVWSALAAFGCAPFAGFWNCELFIRNVPPSFSAYLASWSSVPGPPAPAAGQATCASGARPRICATTPVLRWSNAVPMSRVVLRRTRAVTSGSPYGRTK
ncbi:hypothetical protein K8Z49_30070 [Actinomadura madurae]